MFYECLIKFSNINCVLPVELIRKGFCSLSELDDWSIRNGILLCYPGSCQTSSHLLAFCHLVILFLRKVNNFSLKSPARYGFLNINIGTIVISSCLQFLGCVLWCKVEAVGRCSMVLRRCQEDLGDRIVWIEENNCFILYNLCCVSRPSVPVQFQYFLPTYPPSAYPLAAHTYTPITSSVSTIRQYPGKLHFYEDFTRCHFCQQWEGNGFQ